MPTLTLPLTYAWPTDHGLWAMIHKLAILALIYNKVRYLIKAIPRENRVFHFRQFFSLGDCGQTILRIEF